MIEIKVSESNFLDRNNKVSFNNGRFEYHLANTPDETKYINCSDITKMTYEKPDGALNRSRSRGLIAAISNVFSAAKSMNSAGNLKFDIYFRDEKYLSGSTSMDEYFQIQNAWLDAKAEANK